MTTELKPTKKATRNYYSYSDTPWSIWNVLYGRRSHRKFDPFKPDKDLLDSLEKTKELACRTRGASLENIVVISKPDRVNELRLALFRSFQGGINSWLSVSKPWAIITAELDVDDMSAERPQLLPKVIMAMEDLVLWLAEQGMGTCWMGGFNDKAIARLLGVREGQRVPLVIPVGKPVIVPGFNFDTFSSQSISKRRKPLQKIASVERHSRPYRIPKITSKGFSASGRQGIVELLESINEKSEKSCGADIDLVVDACLESARVAPSASNFQPWHFVVVREKGTLGKLAGLCGLDRNWKVALIASGKTGKLASRLLERPFWMIDVPISMSHISLMAASMGCPAEVITDGIDENAINSLAGLPGDERTVGVIGVK
ncbi:MAG: nitroreductase family protein [Actinobacteria bacterium]|nr:nitroreductase family protein [Actinomycetota bacterium]